MIYTTIYIVTYCTCQETLQYVTAIFHQSDTPPPVPVHVQTCLPSLGTATAIAMRTAKDLWRTGEL